MTLTPKIINEMRCQGRITIDKNLEALLLENYGTEPFPHTYSEQDLYEQTRKIIAQYNTDHAVAPTNLSELGVTQSSDSTKNRGGEWPEPLT